MRFADPCAGQVSLLPPIAAIAASAVAGPSADALIAAGWPVARVRKSAQAVAFLGPAACLVGAAACDDGPTTVGARLLHWSSTCCDEQGGTGFLGLPVHKNLCRGDVAVIAHQVPC